MRMTTAAALPRWRRLFEATGLAALVMASCGSQEVQPGTPHVRMFELHKIVHTANGDSVDFMLVVQVIGKVKNGAVVLRASGLSFGGRRSWIGLLRPNSNDATWYPRARRIGAVDSFIVAASVVFEDSSRDDCAWVGSLVGSVTEIDTSTAQWTLEDSFRRGSMFHYGGFDMIPGPGVWGATPQRMMYGPRRAFPVVALPGPPGSVARDTCEVPLIALVDSDGIVLRAEFSNGYLPRELNRTAVQQVIGARAGPVVFEGHRVSAWTGLIARMPCTRHQARSISSAPGAPGSH